MPPRKARKPTITYKDPGSEDDLSPPPSPPSKAEDNSIASSFVTQTRARKRATRASTLASNDAGPTAISDTRTAGREVYNTLEIRERIFRLIDKETLAGMLRLEKAATASVAAVLYHTVNVSLVSRMSRASPRRVTYCDAVRVLDRNLAPDFPKRRTYRSAKPTQFDGKQLLKDLVVLRKKYPNLKEVVHDFPMDTSSDAYVVRLEGDEVHVDLQTVHHADDDLPGLKKGEPKLPATPKHPGIHIHHMIIFDEHTRNPRGYFVDRDLQKSFEWLYDNKDLDRRLAGVRPGHVFRSISVEDLITFVTRRKLDKCEPITEMTIPYVCGGRVTVAAFAKLLVMLGPELQTLRFETQLDIDAKEGLHTVINMLDSLCPSLQQLSLNYQLYSPDDEIASDASSVSTSNTPDDFSIDAIGQWRGLPKLRQLTLRNRIDSKQSLTFARYLARLGRDDCVYQLGSYYGDERENRLLTNHVRKHKSSRPEHSFLHTVNYADLDIWSLSDLPKLLPTESGGERRRVAWTTLDVSSAIVAEQQRDFKQLIGDIQVGLIDANGDVQAETEVLKGKFKGVAEQQEVLLKACEEMENLMASVKSKSGELARYAERWLQHQPEEMRDA